MTTKQFRIWLLEHNHNQTTVAEAFGLTQTTLSKYCVNNRFPKWFGYALKGLEL